MNLEQSEFKACAPSKDTGLSIFKLLIQCVLLLISIYTLWHNSQGAELQIYWKFLTIKISKSTYKQRTLALVSRSVSVHPWTYEEDNLFHNLEEQGRSLQKIWFLWKQWEKRITSHNPKQNLTKSYFPTVPSELPKSHIFLCSQIRHHTLLSS